MDLHVEDLVDQGAGVPPALIVDDLHVEDLDLGTDTLLILFDFSLTGDDPGDVSPVAVAIVDSFLFVRGAPRGKVDGPLDTPVGEILISCDSRVEDGHPYLSSVPDQIGSDGFQLHGQGSRWAVVIPIGGTDKGIQRDVAHERRSQHPSDLSGGQTRRIPVNGGQRVDAAKTAPSTVVLLPREKVPLHLDDDRNGVIEARVVDQEIDFSLENG